MTRIGDRTARRVALAAIGLAVVVLLSAAGAGIGPGSLVAPQDGGGESGDPLPETGDYEDPIVDYDAVDYELVLNGTTDGETDYSLTVLGAVEPVDDAANGTVDCATQVCRVDGALAPDENATYRISGTIVGVQPSSGLVGHVNGTFEDDALVGTGLGALSPERGGQSDGSTDEPVPAGDDSGTDDQPETIVEPSGDESDTDGDDSGTESGGGEDGSTESGGGEDSGTENGGEEDGGTEDGGSGGEDGASTPPENYSFEVTGLNVLGDDPDDEYVVLNNTGETSVDMSGWTLRDREDGGRVPTNLDPFAFPDGFTLDPDREVTVWTGDGTDDDANLHWGVDVNVWNQTGDTIILRTADGETVLEHEFEDQTENESGGPNVTYENCSTVTIDGEGEFGVEINTEFYGPDGITSLNYEDDVSLPETIDVSGIDDAAVTDVVIEQTTVLDGPGDVAAERPNPDFEACRDEIDAQYEDWQDQQNGDNQSDDGNQSEDGNQSDGSDNGDNQTDGDDGSGGDDEATADDISINYENCHTVSIEVDGDANADDWEFWELSTQFFIEDGVDTMIIAPNDDIPTTVDANERIDGAVTDVEIENVMLTNDGGETFVEASQPDDSCGEQINQQWEEYQNQADEDDDENEETTDENEDTTDESDEDSTDESDEGTDGESSTDESESDEADSEESGESGEEDADEDEDAAGGQDAGEEDGDGDDGEADSSDGAVETDEQDEGESETSGDETADRNESA